MANLTINIPDQYVVELLEAFKTIYPKIDDSNPNDIITIDCTDIAWAKIKIVDYIKKVYSKYKRQQAIATALSEIFIPEDLAE